MKTRRILFFVGLVLLMAGIYLSTLLSTVWIIIGTLMAVIGGGVMGVSTYFLGSIKKNSIC
ncbi:hypothetical protein [Sporosarcina pasteurii]|uniref:Uncharacterized protein n=1 Tax=Sporosarcina pasteurii TaxID=1474 RepID=A0A380BLU8_SPOPA|nr:hypothetical protein [Sporosarcina pasteurii]MDS9470929.1 hypothetical protein [Sporosarcina pasteurii]QBQ05415.1 hypothetical protein E2C16_06910 [Sporosarcina pasteurii]SUJ03312.1 Uncharacterised protein [Sporosarcina pasteurii]